jgi:hypothetical protein
MSITLDEVRAEAVFAGDLQPSEHPPPDLVRRAVTAVLRRYGSAWCAARLAQEYGDHPETAQARMAWALRVVQDCYPRPAGRRRGCHPTRSHVVVRLVPRVPGRCRYPTGRYRHAVGREDRWC